MESTREKSEGSKANSPIGVVGSHELDYPRNQVLQAALQNGGRTVALCHSRARFPWRHVILAWKCWNLSKNTRVLYVTEGGHRLVPLLRIWAKLSGRKILFDPFLSRYNTRVEDRQWYAPGSFQARIAHWQDWSSCHAADFLIFDTAEHRDYFFERYGLEKPSSVVPVGVPESLFSPSPAPNPLSEETIQVLFYGTYIPLQGIETIVRAGALLEDSFGMRIIGKGQTYEAMRGLFQELQLNPEKIAMTPPIPFEALPGELESHHIALGIFGGTEKAARVVPNKVVQAAAMGRPIITADTPAIRRYFTHGENIWLVPPEDPEALAAAIHHLGRDKNLREILAKGVRKVYEDAFSLASIQRIMLGAIDALEEGENAETTRSKP